MDISNLVMWAKVLSGVGLFLLPNVILLVASQHFHNCSDCPVCSDKKPRARKKKS